MRPAVDAYCALAARHGLSPAALAIRFSLTHPAVASSITGATEPQQLVELLAAAHQGGLPEEVMEEIDDIHQRFSSPTP